MRRIGAETSVAGVSFYDRLSARKITFDRFRDLVEKRVKILRFVECLTGDVRIPDVDHDDDDVSHFCCRLICSQKEWTARWFVNTESILFKRRLQRQSDEWIERYFKEEFMRHIVGLDQRAGRMTQKSSYSPERNAACPTKVSCVHFTKCIDLIASRSAKPVNGYCELNRKVMRSVILNTFRKSLEGRTRELCNTVLLNPDERLIKLNTKMLSESRHPTGSESIEACLKYLPPCLQFAIDRFKRERHIMYNDRQLISLFLKECGVRVDDCIQFMRSLFDVNRDVFAKKYLYGIRHNYGLEGKRANYSCFSCKKIIGLSMSDRNFAGCPFVTNTGFVKDFVENCRIKSIEIEDVVGCKGDNYQECCSNLLRALKGADECVLVNSPVEFYMQYKESQNQGDSNVQQG